MVALYQLPAAATAGTVLSRPTAIATMRITQTTGENALALMVRNLIPQALPTAAQALPTQTAAQ